MTTANTIPATCPIPTARADARPAPCDDDPRDEVIALDDLPGLDLGEGEPAAWVRILITADLARLDRDEADEGAGGLCQGIHTIDAEQALALHGALERRGLDPADWIAPVDGLDPDGEPLPPRGWAGRPDAEPAPEADPLRSLTEAERLVIFAALGEVTRGHPWADTARALEARLRKPDGSCPGDHDGPPPAEVLDDVRAFLARAEESVRDGGGSVEVCPDGDRARGYLAEYTEAHGWEACDLLPDAADGDLDDIAPHVARYVWERLDDECDLLAAYAGIDAAETVLGAPIWCPPADRDT